jgi:glycosyltransferase involved in cell wall biosynthesis
VVPVPNVSVIITAYNEEEYIQQALDSFTAQTHENLEIIVVDDGSTDRTLTILLELAVRDARIVVVRNDKNMGKVRSQNRGFASASGDYIAICGGDDYVHPERIESEVAALQEGGYDCVYTNCRLFGERYGRGDGDGKDFYAAPPAWSHSVDVLIRGQSPPGGTAMFTKRLAQEIYPIPESLPYEDRWISFIAFLRGKVGYIHRPLTFYRQHAGNAYKLRGRHKYTNYKWLYVSTMKREDGYVDEILNYLETHGLATDHVRGVARCTKFRADGIYRSGLWSRGAFFWHNRKYLHSRSIPFFLFPHLATCIAWLRARG